MIADIQLPQGKYRATFPRGKTCALYSMKTWLEKGWSWDGSFSQIPAFDAAVNGTAGVNNRLRITRIEIDFIKSLNTNSLKTWTWAADAPTGLYFQSVAGYSIDDCVDWNWVGAPSGHVEDREIMCFSNFQNGMAQVVAAPQSSNYEWARDIPWLIKNIYGNYGAVPLLYRSILFDPSSGFPATKGNQCFWLDASWLYQKVGEVQVPWLA